MSCDIATPANSAVTALTAGEDFTIPAGDVSDIVVPDFPTITFDPPTRLSNEALTKGTLDGDGTFDIIMRSLDQHLLKEREAGRISADQYAKIYVEVTNSGLNAAVQYLLSRDQSYWAAVAAQQQAQMAVVGLHRSRVDLEIAKTQLAVVQLEARTKRAEFALTKAKVATEQVAYCTAEYNLANILPAQKTKLEADTQLTNAQKLMVDEQKTQLTTVERPKGLKEIDILSAQLLNLGEQRKLLQEQTETQRAQTLDTRSDGTTPVGGVLKVQMDLQKQQIDSYKRESELKVAKLFSDAWITQKSIDEGLVPPDNYTNLNVNAVLTSLRTKAGM